MSDLRFEVVDETNGRFEVVSSFTRQTVASGQASPNVSPNGFGRITGGIVSERTPGRIEVIVAFDDGRTAEFRTGSIAGRLELQRVSS